jgi:flavodoxin I
MEKTGIFYGSSTGNAQIIAGIIQKKLGIRNSDVYDVAEANATDLLSYTNIIIGVSTWGNGDMQEDWKDFLKKIGSNSLSDKKVALYGLGDQYFYRNNFADGMGVLYELLSCKNCSFVGSWPLDGYQFENSKAVRNGHFVGLVLDEDNQPELSEKRITEWVSLLKKEIQ